MGAPQVRFPCVFPCFPSDPRVGGEVFGRLHFNQWLREDLNPPTPKGYQVFGGKSPDLIADSEISTRIHADYDFSWFWGRSWGCIRRNYFLFVFEGFVLTLKSSKTLSRESTTCLEPSFEILLPWNPRGLIRSSA